MKKILIVGPAWVGDMVMAQTLFTTLKKQNSDARIEVLAPAWSGPILARMPEVHAAHVMPLGHGAFDLIQRYQLGKSFRAAQFDEAYVLPNSWKSALIPFFAKIPRRVGWRGEWRLGLLNDCRVLDKQRYPLMIERFIALGLEPDAALPDTLPRPALQCDQTNLGATLLSLHLNKDKPILAIAPGAEFGPAKQWPTRHYAAVAKHYVDKGWQVWIMGAAKDSPVANDIQTACDNVCMDLTGKTSLGQAVDLLAQAALVISNDSGLMHIACATARPTVVIYGSSSPKFTPPLAEQVKIETLNLECSPCFQRTCPLGHTNCLNELMPERIIAAGEALIG